MYSAKVMDSVTIANAASSAVVVPVNGFAFLAVEITHDQTIDMSVTGSISDASGRTPVLTAENNAAQTRTGLTATTNGRLFIIPLRGVLREVTVGVTNKSGAADAHVSVWVALA